MKNKKNIKKKVETNKKEPQKKVDIKNKHLFKSKTSMIIHLTLFTAVFVGFIYLGGREYNNYEQDNIRFNDEFSIVPKDNIYEYTVIADVLKATKTDAIVLFGNPGNEHTDHLAKYVNEVAMEKGIEKILYYDFYSDRSINNTNYELLVDRFSNDLYTSDNGDKDFYAASLLVVKDGEVLYLNDETTFNKGNIEVEDYWSSFKIGELKATLDVVFDDYLGVKKDGTIEQ